MKVINTEYPDQWNGAWLIMWGIVLVAVPVLALQLPFAWWPNLSFGQWTWVAIIGFGIPEAISLLSRNDGLPPLTQTIRHFLPGWIAFTYIYTMVGSISATWLAFRPPFRGRALFGLLGWLTEHFTFTYIEGDPRPPKALNEVGGQARSGVDQWKDRRTL